VELRSQVRRERGGSQKVRTPSFTVINAQNKTVRRRGARSPLSRIINTTFASPPRFATRPANPTDFSIAESSGFRDRFIAPSPQRHQYAPLDGGRLDSKTRNVLDRWLCSSDTHPSTIAHTNSSKTWYSFNNDVSKQNVEIGYEHAWFIKFTTSYNVWECSLLMLQGKGETG
jgi:hypothetical protein